MNGYPGLEPGGGEREQPASPLPPYSPYGPSTAAHPLTAPHQADPRQAGPRQAGMGTPYPDYSAQPAPGGGYGPAAAGRPAAQPPAAQPPAPAQPPAYQQAPQPPVAQPPVAQPPAAPAAPAGGVLGSPFGPPPVGVVLDGRYQLESRIATGGMGEVWRGLDQTLGRPVAVKLLRPEYAGDESFLVRFRGEARHAAGITHPGVASVYDYGEVVTDGDRPTAYLVMELVEGEPLSALLHREKRIPAEQTLDILGQAADALQAAHALGVVHRDVKPGNLLIRRDGAIKVTDFGIARAVDAAPLTATGIMMGTAYYVSPEQASGRTVTPASDVYSLGVVAYECLAGRRPFDDRNPIVVVMAHQQDTPPPLPADVPDPVRALIEMAMAKDPSRRPPSAGAFARAAATIRRQIWSPDATSRGLTAPAAVPPGSGAAGAGWDSAGRDSAGRDSAGRSNGGRSNGWDSAGRTGWPEAAGAGRSGAAGAPPGRGRPGGMPLGSDLDERTAMAPAGPYGGLGGAGGRQPELGPPTPAQPNSWGEEEGRLGSLVSKVVNLPTPVLVGVLLLVVLVVALITRTFAGSGGSSAGVVPVVPALATLAARVPTRRAAGKADPGERRD